MNPTGLCITKKAHRWSIIKLTFQESLRRGLKGGCSWETERQHCSKIFLFFFFYFTVFVEKKKKWFPRLHPCRVVHFDIHTSHILVSLSSSFIYGRAELDRTVIMVLNHRNGDSPHPGLVNHIGNKNLVWMKDGLFPLRGMKRSFFFSPTI